LIKNGETEGIYGTNGMNDVFSQKFIKMVKKF